MHRRVHEKKKKKEEKKVCLAGQAWAVSVLNQQAPGRAAGHTRGAWAGLGPQITARADHQ